MRRRPSFFENIVVEYRSLGLRRFLFDQCYFWLAMIIPIDFQMRTGWLITARGYFDYRDSIEFPVIGRWQSLRFCGWRNSLNTQ